VKRFFSFRLQHSRASTFPQCLIGPITFMDFPLSFLFCRDDVINPVIPIVPFISNLFFSSCGSSGHSFLYLPLPSADFYAFFCLRENPFFPLTQLLSFFWGIEGWKWPRLSFFLFFCWIFLTCRLLGFVVCFSLSLFPPFYHINGLLFSLIVGSDLRLQGFAVFLYFLCPR